jgi:hypothetical protein
MFTANFMQLRFDRSLALTFSLDSVLKAEARERIIYLSTDIVGESYNNLLLSL